MDKFIPPNTNQTTVAELKDLASLEYFAHFDCDQAMVAVQAPALSIAVYDIKVENKQGFDKKFDEVKGKLDDFMWESKKAVGGWRVDGPKDAIGEFALFCGWRSVERHTKDFAVVGRIRLNTSKLQVSWMDTT